MLICYNSNRELARVTILRAVLFINETESLASDIISV